MGLVQPTKPASACKPLKVTPSTRGSVAVVQSGTCTLAVKAKHAAAAGFSALLLVEGKKKNKISAQDGAIFLDIPVVRIQSDAAKKITKIRDPITIVLQVHFHKNTDTFRFYFC